MDLVRFSLARYRAFDRKVSVELAPITVVIGGNHSGKTTLCRAPWFVSQPFARGATAPFPFADPSGAPAPSLLRVARGLSGFEVELGLVHEGETWTVGLHASAQVDSNQPMLAHLTIVRGESVLFDAIDLEWDEAQQVIRKHGIEGIHEEVDVLGGLRMEAEDVYRLQGVMPAGVGFKGEYAPMILARSRDLAPLNTWCEKYLEVSYDVERDGAWNTFRITVTDGHSKVLLSESGTGLVQVLPAAAALLLLPRLPSLFTIEHPELHLHPHAHRAIAELLIEGRKRHPTTRFLVETHSDTFVLRLRRAVVEKRIAPEDVRLIYVARGPEGSWARGIHLNERGVPDWWPKGVFAEAQAEYSEMRRKLNEVDRE